MTSGAMASVGLTVTVPTVKRDLIIKKQLHNLEYLKVCKQQYHSSFPPAQHKTWQLLCSKSFPWEASTAYSSIEDDNNIIKGSNIIEPIVAEESPDIPLLQSREDIIDVREKKSSHYQPLKWPMWVLGPLILLSTGMAPTLWLPLSSVFVGPNIAGFLSLLGLDCIFNIGVTLFLLIADACARPMRNLLVPENHVPLQYKIWNTVASILGFLAPFPIIFASESSSPQPHLPFISFLALFGPYLLLLSIQMLTEMLTWHWKSPVWLVTPIIYEAYRILQLMRGLRLGSEVGAPQWAVDSIKVLVSWWVFVLGIQIMRVAWFEGLKNDRSQQQPQV